MENRLEFAATRYKQDRFGLPATKPGCKADKSRKGWVPGVAYRSMTGYVQEILGYTADGQVVVQAPDGEIITHRTPMSRDSKPVYITALGRALDKRR